MYNEINQLPEWYNNMTALADGGILIVDTGSTDGTIGFFGGPRARYYHSDSGEQKVVIIVDDIIKREGYGPARNHLRREAINHFPDAHWLVYFDADERIHPRDFHRFRFLKDYLDERFDVIALPRIDWHDREMTSSENDYRIAPDYQARMTRLASPLVYVRRLHEQVTNCRGIFAQTTNPKINHFHRSAGQKKRDAIGKVCAYLHQKDEYGNTYPEHHKEAYYRELLEKEGLD